MLISDRIATMLLSLLREHGGVLELQRNDMAERLGCSPSQINYVIRSRFSPELGYRVESRRGGGGFIRIAECRAVYDGDSAKERQTSLPTRLSRREAEEMISALSSRGLLSRETAAVMRAAIISDDPYVIALQLTRMLAALDGRS